jgi:5-methyltetrahydropteroyltriglutamate--homocysteine methyltransferase
MATKFNADQVGSFLRPVGVKEARTKFKAGEIDQAALSATEDAAILDALENQKRVGVDIYSDGEFRRSGFQWDLMDAVDGYVDTDLPVVNRMWQGGPSDEQPVQQGTSEAVGARLKQTRRLTGEQTSFLKAHAPGPFKMTLPSANQFPTLGFQKGLTDQFYKDRSELLWDIASIIKSEVTALVGEGVPYIQIDAPRYAYYVDPKWRAHLVDLGEDPEALLAEAVQADADCFDAASGSGALTALHVCRGNNQSMWYAQGGYGPIAEQLFSSIKVDRLLLEYDTERSGNFEPLAHVRPETTVVLGLVSTKDPAMETEDDLLRRIDEASKYVPVERLALSPQCGFASTLAGNALTDDQQWRKLELVVNTARKVWG